MVLHPDTSIESHHTCIQLNGILSYVFRLEKGNEREGKETEKKRNIHLNDTEYSSRTATICANTSEQA